MKKVSFVVVVISVLLLLSIVFIACTKERMKHGELGVMLRIAPNGEVQTAENWDGTDVVYEKKNKENENKKFPGSMITFFKVPSETEKAVNFLKKEEGKWKKKDLYKGLEEKKLIKMNIEEQGIIVQLGPDGNILKVANLDGSDTEYSEPVDFTTARCYIHNGCCWKKVSGRWKCRSKFCPK